MAQFYSKWVTVCLKTKLNIFVLGETAFDCFQNIFIPTRTFVTPFFFQYVKNIDNPFGIIFCFVSPGAGIVK
jgi:hypothetical protein